jgi:hypothetical protein
MGSNPTCPCCGMEFESYPVTEEWIKDANLNLPSGGGGWINVAAHLTYSHKSYHQDGGLLEARVSFPNRYSGSYRNTPACQVTPHRHFGIEDTHLENGWKSGQIEWIECWCGTRWDKDERRTGASRLVRFAEHLYVMRDNLEQHYREAMATRILGAM